MKRSLIVPIIVLFALIGAACSSESSTPSPSVVTETETETASASPAADVSPAPAPKTIDGCVLEAGTNCRKADLDSADLRGYDLRGANFSDATLTSASMHRTNLRDADLHRANLAGANLRDAHLQNSDITDADFSNTNVAYANFEGATATGANFDGAYRCGTVMSDGQIDNSSCEPSPTPSPASTGPTIKYFDVPASVNCDRLMKEDNLLMVSYATRDADSVEITNQHEGDAPTSGEIAIEVPCHKQTVSGKQIKITLTAKGKSGTSYQSEWLTLLYPKDGQ